MRCAPGPGPAPVFSPVGAIEALGRGGFDGLIVEDGVDDASEALRRWLRRRYKGAVVSAHLGEEEMADAEFAAGVASALWKSGVMG